MKKKIYVSAFVVLGILISFLIHTLIEIPAIILLVSDLETWGLGLSWNAWIFIHNTLSIFLLIAGAIFGFKQGKYWWKRVYKE